MRGIVADINIQGQVDLLVTIMQSDAWKLFWDDLNLKYFHFADLGLFRNSVDSLIWETCQKNELVLLTDNRNEDGPDSLQTAIRTRNTATSLPVITVGNVPHLSGSRQYADRVINKLLDFLSRMNSLRGTGRLYVP